MEFSRPRLDTYFLHHINVIKQYSFDKFNFLKSVVAISFVFFSFLFSYYRLKIASSFPKSQAFRRDLGLLQGCYFCLGFWALLASINQMKQS